MTTTQRTDEHIDLGNLLGRRLRERRRELGLTLADVAAAAGISVGHSSSIEKGTTLPSLHVLARVAHVLNLTLAEVLRASPSTRIVHGRIEAKPGTVRLVGAGSRIQVSYAWQPPGAAPTFPFPLAGDDVFAFVDDGTVEIQVDGVRHDLAKGDSIHCHSPRTVTWTASSEAGAGVVWVSGALRSPG
jgi:transcriptional regulator with XRE-family HTH domain